MIAARELLVPTDAEHQIIEMPSVLIKNAWMPDDLAEIVRKYDPKSDLGKLIKGCLKYLPTDDAKELLFKLQSVVVAESRLTLVVFRSLASPLLTREGPIENYGLVSTRLVTDNGAGFTVDAYTNAVEAEDINYHALGTGVGAEAQADAALGTEWAGADYTGGVRATGVQSQPTAPQYRSVGTNTKASAGTSAVTEHGLTSSATVGAGALHDRSVFAAVNLAQSDSLQATYTWSVSAGG